MTAPVRTGFIEPITACVVDKLSDPLEICERSKSFETPECDEQPVESIDD